MGDADRSAPFDPQNMCRQVLHAGALALRVSAAVRVPAPLDLGFDGIRHVRRRRSAAGANCRPVAGPGGDETVAAMSLGGRAGMSTRGRMLQLNDRSGERACRAVQYQGEAKQSTQQERQN